VKDNATLIDVGAQSIETYMPEILSRFELQPVMFIYKKGNIPCIRACENLPMISDYALSEFLNVSKPEN